MRKRVRNKSIVLLSSSYVLEEWSLKPLWIDSCSDVIRFLQESYVIGIITFWLKVLKVFIFIFHVLMTVYRHCLIIFVNIIYHYYCLLSFIIVIAVIISVVIIPNTIIVHIVITIVSVSYCYYLSFIIIITLLLLLLCLLLSVKQQIS